MTQTNFDRHLAKYLEDPEFAERFKRADEAWDVAMQLAKLRQDAGLSQAQLARRLKTSQQQISRLESANYEGHSLSMLRRVAEALNARVIVSLQPLESSSQVNESQSAYPAKSRATSPRRGTHSDDVRAKQKRPLKKNKKTAQTKAPSGSDIADKAASKKLKKPTNKRPTTSK